MATLRRPPGRHGEPDAELPGSTVLSHLQCLLDMLFFFSLLFFFFFFRLTLLCIYFCMFLRSFWEPGRV